MGCRGSCVRITSPRPFPLRADVSAACANAVTSVSLLYSCRNIANLRKSVQAMQRFCALQGICSAQVLLPASGRPDRANTMSVASPRSPAKSTVVSDLAMARAQRNTVLIIDDLFSSRLLLAEIVRQIDGKLNLELFDTPGRAVEFARNNRVDMVLTDYKLPEFDGVQLVRQIRALPHCVDVPIIVITVVDDRRVRYEALEAGATDFLIKPLDEHETRARCANLLDLRRHKIVLSDQARVLQYQVDKSVAEIHERELETLAKLAKAGEFRDRTTGNHLTRMARYSALIGTNLGLAPETVHVLEVAAPMHDIGKIGIPDSILLKEGPLTPEEDGVMKTHPRIGYDILKGSPSKYLSMGAIIALGHHEKFDGSGYPNGLHGEDIPIVGRVVAVADVFDALVSERPYKHAWSIDEGLAYLESQKSKHFDPRCIEAFLSGAEKVKEIQRELGDA